MSGWDWSQIPSMHTYAIKLQSGLEISAFLHYDKKYCYDVLFLLCNIDTLIGVTYFLINTDNVLLIMSEIFKVYFLIVSYNCDY